MQCPFCKSEQVFVTNSRTTKNDSQVWRRRRCSSCKSIFTTHEIIDLSHLIVIKKSGRKQKYDRSKLYSGIYGSTIGLKVPSREKFVEQITITLESQILLLHQKEITTRQIASMVLSLLLQVHAGTFLRFLSYNRDIKTKADIQKELAKHL